MPFDAIEGNKIFYRCDCCGRRIQMGQGLYEGIGLDDPKGTYCRGCFPANRLNAREMAEETVRLKNTMASLRDRRSD